MLATPVNKCKAGEKTMTRFGGTGQMGRKDATGRSRCNVFGKSFCILTITHLVKDVLLLSRKLRWGPFGGLWGLLLILLVDFYCDGSSSQIRAQIG